MSRPSVLIIDDEPTVRSVVVEGLKREGYEFLHATNGEEGLALARDHLPTVIILDLRMPVMDGLEFLARVSLNPSDPYSVIVLTGHGDDSAVKGCYDAGVINFLRKPFELHEIRGAVKSAIALKQLTNELGHRVGAKNAELERRRQEMVALSQSVEQRLARSRAQIQRFHELSREIGALAETARSQQIPDIEAAVNLIADISLHRVWDEY